jgi:hypothetical protein
MNKALKIGLILVLVAGVGFAGYKGYQWYKLRQAVQ